MKTQSATEKPCRPVVAVTSERQTGVTDQLREHGQPVFLFEWRQRPRALEPEKVLEAMIGALRRVEFDPDVDAVVMTGQLVYVSSLLSAVLLEHRRANLLVFDAVNERYLARRVRLK